jgi:hypothetical protein
MIVYLMKKGVEKLAYRIDLFITWIVTIGYPLVIFYGVLMAPH